MKGQNRPFRHLRFRPRHHYPYPALPSPLYQNALCGRKGIPLNIKVDFRLVADRIRVEQPDKVDGHGL